jgi:large-conductance mechanosensitive channel
MKNIDTLQLLKEVVELQQKFDTLNNNLVPTWQKTLSAYSPLIASIITSIVTIYIAFEIFKRTTQREKEFKQENDVKDKQNKIEALEKEKNDLLRKLYVDASSTMMLFGNIISGLNYHNILRNYYLSVSNDPKLEQQYKQQSEEYYKNENNNYNVRADLIRELMSKMTAIVAEYCYIIPESKAMDYLKKFMEENYHMFEKKHFEDKKTISQLKSELNLIVKETQMKINAHLETYCKPMLELMKAKQ